MDNATNFHTFHLPFAAINQAGFGMPEAQQQTVRQFLTNPISTLKDVSSIFPVHALSPDTVAGSPAPMPAQVAAVLWNRASKATPFQWLWNRASNATTQV